MNDKPTLERCILRYWMQGDYDLIAAEEYFAIALYQKDHTLVDILDTADPGQIMEIMKSFTFCKIKTSSEFKYALENCDKDSLVQFIFDMFYNGCFDKYLRGDKQ